MWKNVADVRFGHANRFGAITGNGEARRYWDRDDKRSQL
jgi:hypothetical protein